MNIVEIQDQKPTPLKIITGNLQSNDISRIHISPNKTVSFLREPFHGFITIITHAIRTSRFFR